MLLISLFRRNYIVAKSFLVQMINDHNVQGLENMPISGSTTVGIKRMGKLHETFSGCICKRKYRDDYPEGKAAN
jgi:hypothetical protein